MLINLKRMKNFLKILVIVSAFFLGTKSVNAQHLPPAYEAIFNEIVENFKEIRGGNSIADGKTSLRLLSNERIIIRMDHKRSIKTLTFIKKADEEGATYWMAGNKLTTDMVNKYEKELTKTVEKLLEISRDKAKI